ncbi:MAG: hypothetical protein Q4F05_19130 [bacterium]|nr:hypothetical protein [bacterium]
MEMTYDGALIMPSSFVAIEKDEMTYVEGGTTKVYSGAQGWCVAAMLKAVGSGMVIFSRSVTKAVQPYLAGILAGGPIAWIATALSALGLVGIAHLGGQFASAGAQASWNMLRKGKFTLSANANLMSMISVN